MCLQLLLPWRHCWGWGALSDSGQRAWAACACCLEAMQSALGRRLENRYVNICLSFPHSLRQIRTSSYFHPLLHHCDLLFLPASCLQCTTLSPREGPLTYPSHSPLILCSGNFPLSPWESVFGLKRSVVPE